LIQNDDRKGALTCSVPSLNSSFSNAYCPIYYSYLCRLVRSDERVSFGVLQTRAAQINQVLVGYQHKTKHILTKGV
jgi:uncharacterized iron-regulated protein